MSLRDFVAKVKIRHAKALMPSAMFAFPEDLRKPKHILVCLPAGLRELTIVKQFLPRIADLFKPADVTLLSMPGVKVKDIFPRKGFQILSPSADQITWSGLPKKSYIDHLADYHFDALLDLNLESSVFVSGILLGFPQVIRIGMGNHLGRPFYNLEIKTKYLRDERHIYGSLLDMLDNLRNCTIDKTAANGHQ
jgi:hypothetical protein